MTFRLAKPLIFLSILLIFCFLGSLCLGSAKIPVSEVFSILSGGESTIKSWENIILDYRLPKAFTSILVGSSLGISGLLMQTLFKNPLAGPFVLGISSGASLGVAFVILGSGLFGTVLGGILISKWGLIIASSLGSFLVLMAVIAVSSQVRDTMTILIIGLMFGSITSALVSVMSYFSSAEQLQQFVFWGFGSISNLSWSEVIVFFIVYVFGLLLSVLVLKHLNSLLLGDDYAQSLGVNIKRNRLLIILATSLLAGVATAFAGPIAFIGLAIPHLARQIFKTSNHQVLLPAIFLIGAIVMLICDAVAQLPFSEMMLPLNAVTSLVGAPVVIWLLVKQRKMIF